MGELRYVTAAHRKPAGEAGQGRTAGKGVSELVHAIWTFREHTAAAQAARRRSRSEYRLRELVSQRFMQHLADDILTAGEFSAIVDRIARRELDPYTAANDLLQRATRS